MLRYEEFIGKVNEAGFLTPFSNYINPEIFTFSEHGQAYTGDPETDTSKWSIRAAQEKKLACGYFFNGKPRGFIAPHYVSIFVDAFSPRITVEERYEAGNLGKYELMIWALFEKTGKPLEWSEIWQHYEIKDKAERRLLDAALKNMQMTFELTISGGKTNGFYKNGDPIISIVYDKVDNWVPEMWMKMNPRMEHEEALEIIYRQAEKISSAGDSKKAFTKSLKLCKSFS